MEQKELDILNIIAESEDASQREIARQTGMSLGLVNLLIKKCVKKGLLKIERLNSRSLKYMLTPKGLNEKSHKTLSFIKRSYQAILTLSNQIRLITHQQIANDYNICIMGQDDEILQLVTDTLNEMQVNYQVVQSLAEIEAAVIDKTAIYYWDSEFFADQINESDYLFINVIAN